MVQPSRSTAENVVVLLALAVFLVIVILTIGLVAEAVWGADEDNTRLINWMTSIIDTIIGALIGFVAGAAVVRSNGKPT